MACQDCKKVKLNSCEKCDFTVPTDCVEYKGDKLSFEASGTKNGSSRDLTSILESLDEMLGCRNREAKIIQGDYTVLVEDDCSILLLDGAIDTAEDYTYTITLPETEDFYNKVIVIKDISEGGSPSGEVIWQFDTAIQTNHNPVEDETLFSNIAWGSHKVVELAFLKTDGVNWEWVVISPSIGLPEVLVITDDDMVNSWATQTSSEVRLHRLGKHRQLEGLVTDGTKNTTVFTLLAKDRPANDLLFASVIDASPYTAIVNVTAAGAVQVSLPGYAGATVTSSDSVTLSGISWYVD